MATDDFQTKVDDAPTRGQTSAETATARPEADPTIGKTAEQRLVEAEQLLEQMAEANRKAAVARKRLVDIGRAEFAELCLYEAM